MEVKVSDPLCLRRATQTSLCQYSPHLFPTLTHKYSTQGSLANPTFISLPLDLEQDASSLINSYFLSSFIFSGRCGRDTVRIVTEITVIVHNAL